MGFPCCNKSGAGLQIISGVHRLLELRPQRVPRAHCVAPGRRLPGSLVYEAHLSPARPLPNLPASASEDVAESFSGSQPAGPRQREDVMVNGLAQCLCSFFSLCIKARTRRPGNPVLGSASGNCCLSSSSSRRRICVLSAGQALTVLRVPEMAPAESPKAGHIWLTQPGTEAGRGSGGILPEICTPYFWSSPHLCLQPHH